MRNRNFYAAATHPKKPSSPEKAFKLWCPTMSFLIAPSILSADFSKLGAEIDAITQAGADWVHVDVMDGQFVPNLTIGAPVVKSIKPVTKLPLDVHLMIVEPERFVDDFVRAGADYLTIHVESTNDPLSVLRHIRKQGVKPGITLRPGTPLELIIPFLPEVDLILVMTVEPGFGGQSFMSDQVDKVNRLADERARRGLNYLIEVDGGITDQTAQMVLNADVLVAGSFVFKGDVRQAISRLKGVKP